MKLFKVMRLKKGKVKWFTPKLGLSTCREQAGHFDRQDADKIVATHENENGIEIYLIPDGQKQYN